MGTGRFVSEGPYGHKGGPPLPPQNRTKLFILDFNCQPLRGILFCFMSAGPYGPGGVLFHFEGGRGSILGKTHSILKNWKRKNKAQPCYSSSTRIVAPAEVCYKTFCLFLKCDHLLESKLCDGKLCFWCHYWYHHTFKKCKICRH